MQENQNAREIDRVTANVDRMFANMDRMRAR